MKAISQTKDFSVCFHNRIIPKYSLYGNIYNTLFFCIDTHIINGGYKITVWVDKKGGRNIPPHWENTHTSQGYGAIFLRIRQFMSSAEYIDKPVEFCAHKTYAKERAYQKNLAQRIKKAREEERDLASVLPKERKTQIRTHSLLPTYSQSAVDGRGYSLDWEENYVPVALTYVGDDASINQCMHRNDKPFFENGQNTAGELAFIPKRNGMKTSFKDYRPEDNRPRITGYVPKDGTLQSARIEKILAGDIEELRYHIVNSQKINSKVLKMVEDKWGTLEEFRRLYSC